MKNTKSAIEIRTEQAISKGSTASNYQVIVRIARRLQERGYTAEVVKKDNSLLYNLENIRKK